MLLFLLVIDGGHALVTDCLSTHTCDCYSSHISEQNLIQIDITTCCRAIKYYLPKGSDIPELHRKQYLCDSFSGISQGLIPGWITNVVICVMTAIAGGWMCVLCSAQATDSNNQVTATVSAILMQSIITWSVGTMLKMTTEKIPTLAATILSVSDDSNKSYSLSAIYKICKEVVFHLPE